MQLEKKIVCLKIDANELETLSNVMELARVRIQKAEIEVHPHCGNVQRAESIASRCCLSLEQLQRVNQFLHDGFGLLGDALKR